MPDVAVMLGLPLGQASFTVAPITNSASDTVAGSKKYVFGPPVNGMPNAYAAYILQVMSTDANHTANTYRWTGDHYFNGAALTTWSYFGNAFVSIGGI